MRVLLVYSNQARDLLPTTDDPTAHEVAEGQSIVFLTPSVINLVTHARFYDDQGQVHQVPADRILSIDPEPPPLRLPVRYLDPETGDEVKHREGK